MTISMYGASVPLFRQLLSSLANVLDKAAAFAEAKKIDPAVLLQARLAPDMLPLIKQIQIASDAAKGAVARLAGAEVPSWPDDEITLDQAKARVAKSIAFVDGFTPAKIDGSEDREIVLKLRDRERRFTGQQYLLHWAIPNFTFHVTTAYAILRHNGVDLGKRDFLGQG